MTTGYVYVLSHHTWSGAVKIGRTTKNPAVRSLQIASSSGLLTPPVVEWCCWVADCGAVELAVHRTLGEYRVTASREMFYVTADGARSVIEAATQTRAVALKEKSRRRQARVARVRRKRYGISPRPVWAAVRTFFAAILFIGIYLVLAQW